MWGDTLLLKGRRSQRRLACPPSALAAGRLLLDGGRRPPANARPASRLHYPAIFPAAAMWGPLSFSFFTPHTFPATAASVLLAHASTPVPHPWPLVAPSMCPATGSSLTHECGQGENGPAEGLDTNRRQQDLQFKPADRPYTPTPCRHTHQRPRHAHTPTTRPTPVIADDWRCAYMDGETHMTRRCELTRFHIAHPTVFSDCNYFQKF